MSTWHNGGSLFAFLRKQHFSAECDISVHVSFTAFWFFAMILLWENDLKKYGQWWHLRGPWPMICFTLSTQVFKVHYNKFMQTKKTLLGRSGGDRFCDPLPRPSVSLASLFGLNWSLDPNWSPRGGQYSILAPLLWITWFPLNIILPLEISKMLDFQRKSFSFPCLLLYSSVWWLLVSAVFKLCPWESIPSSQSLRATSD